MSSISDRLLEIICKLIEPTNIRFLKFVGIARQHFSLILQLLSACRQSGGYPAERLSTTCPFGREGITAIVFALETPEPEARLNGVLRPCTVGVEHKIPKCCGLPAHEPL